LCFVCLPPVSCVSHVVSDSECSIQCCVLFAFLLCLVCPMLSVTLDFPFRVVFCLPFSCVLCVPCCQWLWMFHSVLCFIYLPPVSCVSHVVSDSACSVLCFVCFPPVSCVSHVVSDSGCSIPCCVLFAFLLCLVCSMLSVTLDLPFRVVFCLPSSCVSYVPCC